MSDLTWENLLSEKTERIEALERENEALRKIVGLKLFTCIDHNSFWVGGASIVLASDETEARHLLNEALRQRGLAPNDYTLIAVETTR